MRRHLLYLFGLVLVHCRHGIAQSTATTSGVATATASATYNVFSAIASATPDDSAGENAQPGNAASNPMNPAGQNAAGASGGSDGSFNLSTGDTIAICVIVALVVLVGVTSAVLFYLAKKRQWEVRASLRRSVRRVTSVVRPKTPRGRQPSSEKLRGLKPMRLDTSVGSSLSKGRSQTPSRVRQMSDRDLEKGFGGRPVVKSIPPSLPPLPQQTNQRSSFQMDSPPTVPKTWAKKFFGERSSWLARI